MKQKKCWMLLMLMTVLLVSACGNGNQEEQRKKAEDLIEKAHKARNYNLLMATADSLERDGSLSPAIANYWLGYASDRLKKKRMAEFYWKASLEAASQSTDDEDVEIYAMSGSRLANMLCVRGDYEGALKIAVPVATRLEKLKCDSISDYVNLLIYIGCCQAAINDPGEATFDGFERAYQNHLTNIENNHDDAAYKNAFAGLVNIVHFCNEMKKYKEAQPWINRFGELLNEYEQRNDASGDYIDKQLARFNLYKAMIMQGLGETEEAAKAFEAFNTTEYSKTPEGRINSNNYLTAAKRWDEAAENYSSLDALLGKHTPYTLDNIENLLLKKYQANLIAGRRDSAMAVSMNICDSLSHAFTLANLLDKEEQSTIVDRVERMTEQQAKVAHRERLKWNGLIVLIVLAIIAYAFYRHRVSKRIQSAHQDLQAAYDELEDKITSREQLIAEQRIAHDIQETILPEALPQHKDIQICVSQTRGKMEGSAFYDCYIRDGKLFLCMGDVAQDGAQASLLTAVTKAQFRTASTYETEPERIQTVMNGTVSKELVRLFIGVLDLSTGILHYQNAGQVEPLVMTTELSRLPEHSQEVTLSSGTLLFFFTRGLLKAENGKRRQFGEKYMLGEALQAMKVDPSPKPFVDSMLNAVRRFAGDHEQSSDIVMLSLKYKK